MRNKIFSNNVLLAEVVMTTPGSMVPAGSNIYWSSSCPFCVIAWLFLYKCSFVLTWNNGCPRATCVQADSTEYHQDTVCMWHSLPVLCIQYSRPANCLPLYNHIIYILIYWEIRTNHFSTPSSNLLRPNQNVEAARTLYGRICRKKSEEQKLDKK